MPKKQTWEQRIAAYMVAHNYIEVQRRTKKYRAFKLLSDVGVDGRDSITYYLGSNGAVRVSRKGGIAESISVTDSFHKKVIMYEGGDTVVARGSV